MTDDQLVAAEAEPELELVGLEPLDPGVMLATGCVVAFARAVSTRPSDAQRARRFADEKGRLALVSARTRAAVAVEQHRGDVREYLGLARELAEYRWRLDAEPAWIVDLIPSARRVIEGECRAAEDGTETGGFLVGYPTSTRTFSVVLGATGPGPNAERFADAVILDRQHAEREPRRQRLDVVGAWHTHAQSAFRTFRYGGRISPNDARAE